MIRGIFLGPNGLRAGWRLAIYIVLVAGFIACIRFVRHHFLHVTPPAPDAPLEPVHELVTRSLAFLALSAAALIMTRFERAKWGDYGLPVRRALSLDFWFGCLWGLVGVSVVMASLGITGAYRIEGLALAAPAAFKFGILWAVMFLMVGLLEEFSLRGYTQYTLASGIGFWPAAVLLSALFLAGHIKNSGENWMGLADVFIIGMFLCFTLWRTGDLWFAVGLHAVWDWGLTFLYSVPNSGTTAVGHLFNVHSQGPEWLSGGSAGPEGSVINLVFDILYFFLFAMFYKKRKWVGMDDQRRAREAAVTSTPVIDSSALSS
jgi:membrane protease YdiL (CAAX protease family)